MLAMKNKKDPPPSVDLDWLSEWHAEFVEATSVWAAEEPADAAPAKNRAQRRAEAPRRATPREPLEPAWVGLKEDKVPEGRQSSMMGHDKPPHPMHARPPPRERVLRVGEVAEVLGVTKSTVWRNCLVDPTFPKKIRIGSGSVGWLESSIIAWLNR
jgi:predicted DNA-binding transcriptional regulator AlpA